MAKDRINRSTERMFNSVRETNSKRKSKGQRARMRVSDGTRPQEHRRDVDRGHRQAPAAPKITPNNAHMVPTKGTMSVEVGFQWDTIPRTSGHTDLPRRIFMRNRRFRNESGLK